MNRRRCLKCDLPHLDGPFARACHYDEFRAALGDIKPTKKEDASLRWLARLEESTTSSLVSLFFKARGGFR